MLNFLLFAVNKDALTKSFNILWQGLLAMVIVVGVIIAFTYVIKNLSECTDLIKQIRENKKENKQKEESEKND
ncbi:MAG: hypothetical protein PUK12_03825 [Clostridiales bacterium]|nr:hypothetical protein [Clostridiales bacterium]MDY5726789.1 hypothetical protein [Eubacteriales bacterium]